MWWKWLKNEMNKTNYLKYKTTGSKWKTCVHSCTPGFHLGETICFCVRWTFKYPNIKFTVVLDIIITCWSSEILQACEIRQLNPGSLLPVAATPDSGGKSTTKDQKRKINVLRYCSGWVKMPNSCASVCVCLCTCQFACRAGGRGCFDGALDNRGTGIYKENNHPMEM